MWYKFFVLIRLIITLKDIGLFRIYLRLRYEFLTRFDSIFPFFWKWLNKEAFLQHNWLDSTLELSNHKLGNIEKKDSNESINSIKFNFLNKTEEIKFPINWNNKKWIRLWKFNLHYFDWARNAIDVSLENNSLEKEIFLLDDLINEWIVGNPIGFGDGWHSYTLSLRIRNWIFIFRTFPNIVNEEKLQSLWVQICWLYKHPEVCHGGNHWIENLTALIIGSLQFKNLHAHHIYLKSIKLLRKALEEQILNDGGHEERSAAYHILILDRLVEVGWVIQSIRKERPFWLHKYIERMTDWIILVELEGGRIPLFNDSPSDICPKINLTKEFSISYLENKENFLFGIRKLLSTTSRNFNKSFVSKQFLEIKSSEFNFLPDTGWSIVRLEHGWELIFKCGEGCPKYLPAHTHSDLLSFDLFKNGIPIIAEAGTSYYGNSTIRKFERSSAAHNVLRLSIFDEFNKKKSKWIEPIDVWGNFRAGRKANILSRSYQKLNKSNYELFGSHDGFKKIGASYQRTINLFVNKKGDIQISVKEEITCKKTLIGNQVFNLGPTINPSFVKTNIYSSNLIKNPCCFWKDTHFAVRFGKTLPRKTFISSFILPEGQHQFEIKILIPNKKF